MRRILLILILFVFSIPAKGIDEDRTAGGWVTVKALPSSKYEVVCNLLYCVDGYKNNYGIPTHSQLASGDTNVFLRVYDSAGNYLNLYAKFIRGYYYTQKDTSNTQISPGGLGEFFLNKYYRLIFKCTLDLNSPIVKSAINVNSTYLDFTCDFTGETWCEMVNWNMNSIGCVSPTSTTRVYLKNLPTSVSTVEPNHVAFTKIMDYSARNYYATNYYNPGFYVPYGDSIQCEMIEPQASIKNIKSMKYNAGISASVPFYTYCKDTSNSCSPKPNTTPPQGFYFNSFSSDMVFSIFKYAIQSSQFAIRCHHYSKSSNNTWLYMGYTTLTHNMTTNYWMEINPNYPYISGTIFPTFILPTTVDVCEGDSLVVGIKTQVTKAIHKYTASLDGNFPNASVSTDYSTGNSTPTFKIKLVAKSGNASSAPGIVTLRVHADSNWVNGEAARSMPVYVHLPLKPEIVLTTNGCNNLKGILKTVNTDVAVKVTWTIYEGSLNSPAIFTTTDKTLLYSALLPRKYYVKCFVMPLSSNCKCSGKTVIDSLDMKSLWPNFQFDLNRNTVCLNDSSKVYFATQIKNFKTKVKCSWEANDQSIYGFRDTLSLGFTAATTIKLTLQDDSGCVAAKTFILPVDTIYGLILPSSLLNCGEDTLVISATSPYNYRSWMSQYHVIDATQNVIYTTQDTALKYFYKEPNYTVLSEFVSQNGCNTSYKTEIVIDTTKLRFKAMPTQLCMGMKSVQLSDIGATPVGGTWTHNAGSSNIIPLDEFTQYPSKVWFTYQYNNPDSKCNFVRSDSFWVTDTIKSVLGGVDVICKETKHWNAPTAFGLMGTGVWYSPNSALAIDSTGWIHPSNSNSGNFKVYRHSKNSQGCDYQSEGVITIAPKVLNISGTLSATFGKPPLLVNFEGKNTLTGATQYKWIFGDIKQSPKDTAWGSSVGYTYKDTGRFYPRLIGKIGACSDTINVGKVEVGILESHDLVENDGVQLYPNPSGAGNEVLLRIAPNNRERHVVVYNAVGKKIAEYRFEKGQELLALTVESAGVYFIEIEGLVARTKWLVE